MTAHKQIKLRPREILPLFLRRARCHGGWGLKDIANDMGFKGHVAVVHWEMGHSYIHWPNITQAAVAYGVSVSDMLQANLNMAHASEAKVRKLVHAAQEKGGRQSFQLSKSPSKSPSKRPSRTFDRLDGDKKKTKKKTAKKRTKKKPPPRVGKKGK